LPATFISKASEFQVVLEQPRKVVTPGGTETFEGGNIIEFGRGNESVPGDGNGRYTATDEKTAQALRDAKTFNREFVELGKEPGRLLPDEDELIDKITNYAVDRDSEKIRQIKVDEEATHNRRRVIRTAEIALGRLGEPDGKRTPGRPKVA
jgi:hypothetical protein